MISLILNKILIHKSELFQSNAFNDLREKRQKDSGLQKAQNRRHSVQQT